MLKCLKCGRVYEEEKVLCECGGFLEVIYDYDEIEPKFSGNGLKRYINLLPIKKEIFSLGEGQTPLIKLRKYKNLYAKNDGLNPSGSFKDRGSYVGIHKALELGKSVVSVASTGNMGASVACYAAAAGIRAKVYVPKGVSKAKLAQIIAYSAEIVETGRYMKDAVQVVLSRRKSEYPVMNALNPYYVEGFKTTAYELFEELGNLDFVFVPTGSGGNAFALYKGFNELKIFSFLDDIPKIVIVQPEKCSAIVDSYEKGLDYVEEVEDCETIAGAIRIKAPLYGSEVLKVLKKGNIAVKVSEEEIKRAMFELGREGIFAEPSAAVSLAGFKKACEQGVTDSKDVSVVLITGNGLKDPTAFI